MRSNIWNHLKTSLSNWRIWTLPGIVVMGLIVAARLTGSLQSLELIAFDTFLRLRPSEPEDDRVVLIGINAGDIEKIGYPVPEAELTELITKLQTYKPSVIGLHILSNQIAPASGGKRLADLGQSEHVIVAEKILPASDQIPPPSGFSENQIGLIDIVTDGDSHLRRVLLGAFDPIKVTLYKKSLIIHLVEAYLTSIDKKLNLQNGIRDRFAMRFGTTELPRLFPDSGGYAGADTGGPQMLLNARMGPHPFRVISLNEIKTGKIDPVWLRDRIVIVGITDPLIRPGIPTAATLSTNSLDLQAHSVSQILSAVLDGRPLLTTWTNEWQYTWIIFWGCIGVIVGQRTQYLLSNLLVLTIINFFLLGISYLCLEIAALWIPVIPVLLVLNLNVIFPAIYSYVYEQEKMLKSRLEERQKTIEQTFNTIHNGPLQTLATLLRVLRDSDLPQKQILTTLENLNLEIRNIGEHLKQESLAKEGTLYLRDSIKLDLQLPAHELFYEVYSNTLDRPEFSNFETLKIYCDFEPIDLKILNIEQKRDLCRFLEEALCNVGKHAEGATHLTVTGNNQNNCYILRIMDDGIGLRFSREGQGTKQARRVASYLRGKFKRESVFPKGTLCELTLPLVRPWFW